MSAEVEAGVKESLELLQRWLKEEERGGLSIAQPGGLLALVCIIWGVERTLENIGGGPLSRGLTTARVEDSGSHTTAALDRWKR